MFVRLNNVGNGSVVSGKRVKLTEVPSAVENIFTKSHTHLLS